MARHGKLSWISGKLGHQEKLFQRELGSECVRAPVVAADGVVD